MIVGEEFSRGRKANKMEAQIEVKEFKTTDERANHMFQYRVVK